MVLTHHENNEIAKKYTFTTAVASRKKPCRTQKYQTVQGLIENGYIFIRTLIVYLKALLLYLLCVYIF